MAKAILEFNLDEPEDVQAHKRAAKALDMMLAFWEIDQHLRAQVKYNDNLTDEAYEALSEVRTKFYEILNAHSISFDELLS